MLVCLLACFLTPPCVSLCLSTPTTKLRRPGGLGGDAQRQRKLQPCPDPLGPSAAVEVPGSHPARDGAVQAARELFQPASGWCAHLRRASTSIYLGISCPLCSLWGPHPRPCAHAGGKQRSVCAEPCAPRLDPRVPFLSTAEGFQGSSSLKKQTAAFVYLISFRSPEFA